MKNLVNLLIISIIFMGVTTSVYSQQGEKLFQQAMVKEQGEGNLNEAIALYTKLTKDVQANRKLRAKAQLQVGICYEKLGKKNALNAYEKVIAEYADQTDMVKLARKKLKSLKGTGTLVVSTGLVSQRIAKGIPQGIVLDKISPDGLHYSYYEARFNSDEIMTYNMVTGKKDSITTGNTSAYEATIKSNPFGSRWSPDGNSLAYTWWHGGDEPYKEIHIVDRKSLTQKVVLTGDEAVGLMGVRCFSPDGTKLLFAKLNTDKEMLIMEVTIASGATRLVSNIGKVWARGFNYSPDGTFIAYAKTQSESKNYDIYITDLGTGKHSQITNNLANDLDPVWSRKGDQLAFFSNRLGSSDLYVISVKNGTVSGVAKSMFRNVGENPQMLGQADSGAVYFSAQNSKNDLYTVELDKNLDLIPESLTQISDPGIKFYGSTQYSKDGKFISYSGRKISDLYAFNSQIKSDDADPNLGYAYHIQIYNTADRSTRELNIDLHANHTPFAGRWHVPTWSYFGNQLLVHGQLKDKYTGGFFIVDVDTEKITPVQTVEDSRKGNFKNMGNSMIFSRKKDLIYYSSPDWKDIMQYNMKTKEEQSIARIDDGAWFNGFLDEAETKIQIDNRFGTYIIDRNTNTKKRVEDLDGKLFVDYTEDGRKKLYLTDLGREFKGPAIAVFSTDGATEEKVIRFNSLFPESTFSVVEKHPVKNQFLIEVTANPGAEIYKISQLFN